MKESVVQKWIGEVGLHTVKRVRALTAHPAVGKCLKLLLHFGLGYCLSQGVIFKSSAPFGVAFVAAGGVGLGGVGGFFGALLGYILMWESANGLSYVAATILVFITAIVFANTSVSRRAYFMPLVAVLATAAVSFVFVFTVTAGSSSILLLTTELVLVAGVTYFFQIALQDSLTIAEDNRPASVLRRLVSFVILFSAVLISLSKITLGGVISPGRTAALLVVMFLALRGGAGAGASGGVSIGLAMDLAWGTPYFSMAYGVSGMMAGVFRENGRLWSVSIFVVSHAVSTLWLDNNLVRSSVLFEAFAASVLFMLIPDSALGTIKRRFMLRAGASAAHAEATPDDRAQRQAAQLLDQTATAFTDLYKALEVAWTAEEKEPISDEALIIDRVASRLCDRCALKRICWEKEFERTCESLQQAALALRKRRKLAAADFAPWFQARCMSFGSFIEAANEEAVSLFYQKRYTNRMRESRGLVCHQYAETARLLRGMTSQLTQGVERYTNAELRVRSILEARHANAEVVVSRPGGRVCVEIEGVELSALYNDRRELTKELGAAMEVALNAPERQAVEGGELLLFTECEPFRAQLGAAARQKVGESVSGDSGTYFKLPDGRLVVLLSDGMGSGRKAAQESHWVVRLLERFLRVGIAPETALRTINSALLVKGDMEGGFVTVDLLIVNLLNGEAVFYKFGAAPSYIKRGEKVHRVTCTALPAGMAIDDSRSLDVTRVKLINQNIVVVASDGVADPSNDAWLQAIVARTDGDDCKAVADEILQTAKTQNGGRDDMSVLVLRLMKR